MFVVSLSFAPSSPTSALSPPRSSPPPLPARSQASQQSAPSTARNIKRGRCCRCPGHHRCCCICVALRCIALRCVALHYVATRVALRYVAVRYVAWRCVTLRSEPLRCVAPCDAARHFYGTQSEGGWARCSTQTKQASTPTNKQTRQQANKQTNKHRNHCSPAPAVQHHESHLKIHEPASTHSAVLGRPHFLPCPSHPLHSMRKARFAFVQ